MDDPDCTGPCDNNEGGLYPNLPSQSPPCKVDCFFGTESNHDCYWDHACDQNETAANNYAPESNVGPMCAYNPAKIVNPPGKTCAQLLATQSTACTNYCKPITPNGCDCFGCCELPAGTGHFVWLGSTNPQGAHCTLDPTALDDPMICQPCTVVPACYNPCGPCKVCIGKPTLEPGFANGQTCDAGAQPCGQVGQAACQVGQFCKTGCCYPLPQ
jgi:hypothetical protein